MIKPYIDAEYYNNIYKPNKNGRIEGTFNKVASNKANFDAFRNRASEIVDRLLGGKITKLGGLEKMSDTTAKELIKLSTGAFVEFWYNRGFNMASLNSSLNMGSASAQQILTTEKFRDITPFSVLANLQKTGMWDHKAISIDLEKELSNMGIGAEEILTVKDAMGIFELKDMGLNFHIEADFSGELTGLPNQKRWIEIASTETDKILMEIVGGTKEFVKTELQIKRDGNGNVIEEQAFIYSAQVAQDTPDYWYKLDGDKILLYIEVEDDQEDKIISLSNAYPDQTGNYGVLGSVDNSNGLTKMTKLSIIDHIASVAVGTFKKYNDPQDIDASANGTIGYVEKSTGDVDIILKTALGVKIFKDTTSLLQYIDNENQTQDAKIHDIELVLPTMNQDILDNKNNIASQTTNISTNANNIAKKQNEVGLYVDKGNVGVKTGKFSSLDQNGARQIATDNDDLVDKEYVDKKDKDLETRTLTLETNTIKKSESKSLVGTSNKVITENEEELINDRLDALEKAEELTDKVFDGSVQATTDTDLTQIHDQNGDAFTFPAGKMIQIFIKNKTINTGKGYLMKVGDTTKTGFVIPKGGGTSEHIDATLNTSGILHLVESGSGTLADYEIYRVIEKASIAKASNSYTKTEVNNKLALKAPKDKFDTYVNIINGTDAPITGEFDPIYANKSLDNLDSAGETIIDNRAKDKANEVLKQDYELIASGINDGLSSNTFTIDMNKPQDFYITVISESGISAHNVEVSTHFSNIGYLIVSLNATLNGIIDINSSISGTTKTVVVNNLTSIKTINIYQRKEVI